MRKIHCAAMMLCLILGPVLVKAQTMSCSNAANAILRDYVEFYSRNNLCRLILGLGYGAFYANTTFDAEIQNLYHDYFRTKTTDDISRIVKQFGNGRLVVPLYLAIAGIGCFVSDQGTLKSITNWGQECARALLVGAPLVLGLQVLTGASRPNEDNGSKWHPFKDNNGVSGHSFMGAMPFLIAAKRTDNQLVRIPLYLGSTLTALSRINDNQHFFSQAFLGWWIAWLATHSIKSNTIHISPAANGIEVLVNF